MATVANGHAEPVTKSSRKKSPATSVAAPAVAPVAAAVTQEPVVAGPAPRTRKSKTQDTAVAPAATAPTPVVASAAPAAEPEKKSRSRKAAAQPVAPAAPAAPEKKPRARSQPKTAETKTAETPTQPATEKKSRSRKQTESATSAATPAKGKSKTESKTAESKDPSAAPAESKPRAVKNHVNAFEAEGIVTASSRVKDYLDSIINAEHERIVDAIREAQSKPKPPVFKDGVQQPAEPHREPKKISELPKDIVAFINEAENQYKQRLVEKYERTIIQNLKKHNKKKYDEYMKERQAAQAAAETKGEEFNLEAFNKKTNPSFYNELPNAIKNDILTINTVHKNTVRCPDEWTRAIAVVNKTRIHFAKSTKIILSGFLDNIPRQLITNGIHNILQAGRSQVKLEFCLNQSAGFEKRVTLFQFLRSLSVYETLVKWVNECYAVTQANSSREKDQQLPQPARPAIIGGDGPVMIDGKPINDRVGMIFKQSVGNVFNSVRSDMIKRETDEEKKRQLQMIKFSDDARLFCSGLIYEAITRIAKALARRINQEEKKTIRPFIMENMIIEMMELLGISDVDVVMNDIKQRKQVFDEAAKRRKAEKDAKAKVDAANGANQPKKIDDELDYDNE